MAEEASWDRSACEASSADSMIVLPRTFPVAGGLWNTWPGGDDDEQVDDTDEEEDVDDDRVVRALEGAGVGDLWGMTAGTGGSLSS